MKSMTNYVMGIVLIAAGCFFFFSPTEGMVERYDLSTLRMFAVICWIYGIFRVYRGYKKNYFRNS